jgi:hypothetical protein
MQGPTHNDNDLKDSSNDEDTSDFNNKKILSNNNNGMNVNDDNKLKGFTDSIELELRQTLNSFMCKINEMNNAYTENTKEDC